MKKIKRSKSYPPEFAPRRSVGAALLSAAMVLPLAGTVHADSAPERGLVSIKHLNYQESQPGDSRIHINANEFLVVAPISGEWSFSGTYTADAISGASPAYYTSNITNMNDQRHELATDVTRYFPNGTLTVGANVSSESDYLSRGVSVNATRSNESKNTTWSVGIGINSDLINPNNHIVVNETKHVSSFLLGVTQILTINDIVLFNLGRSNGNGYYSDPYKILDNRPREHNSNTFMTRWNHYFESTQGTSHLSYRYYTDSWSIKAHTLGLEYVQPLSNGWTLTPLIRLHTQSAASFYLDAPPDQFLSPFAPLPTGYHSEDPRVAAFSARTLGLKIAKQLDANWLVDVKFENYQQRASLSFLGGGSPNLAPFDARSLQLGLSRQF